MTANPATCLQDSTLGSGGTPTSTSQIDATTIDATYSGTTNVGDNWTFSWNPSEISSPTGMTTPEAGTAI